jgi:hypothetical protein
MAYLNDQDRAFLQKQLGERLAVDVTLKFFTQSTAGLAVPGPETEACERTGDVLKELVALSPRLRLASYSVIADRAAAEAHGIARIPAIAPIGAQDYGMRLYGMPVGYGFMSLLEAIFAAATGTPALSPGSLGRVAALAEPLHVQVLSTPT